MTDIIASLVMEPLSTDRYHFLRIHILKYVFIRQTLYYSKTFNVQFWHFLEPQKQLSFPITHISALCKPCEAC
jgi:hypothetical protein